MSVPASYKVVHGLEIPAALSPKRVPKRCICCGAWFSLPRCHAHMHHSCSAACGAAFRRARSADAASLRKRTCEQCGKTFVPRQWQLDTGVGKYCSAKCRNVAVLPLLHSPEARRKARIGYQAADARGEIPRLSGPEHPKWKEEGSTVSTGNGYIREKSKARYRAQHRLVMERFLGRPLLRSEVVHHINHDKTDNRLENLQLLTASEHQRLHALDPSRKRGGVKGEANHHAKLTEDAVRRIRASQERGTELARQFGVTQTLIYMVRAGKIWRHV